MNIQGIVEIPKGSNYKYEIDKPSGLLVLDRVLELHYPYNYGFIQDTLSEDGDALDVFIHTESPIHPLTRVNLEVVGVIEMTDNGVEDNKLICLIKDSSHPFDSSFSQISYFLNNYKKGVVINKVSGKERALEVLQKSRDKLDHNNNRLFPRQI